MKSQSTLYVCAELSINEVCVELSLNEVCVAT